MDPILLILIKFLLITLILAIAALVQGSAGFGSALIAAPLLVMIDPQYVPGPLMCAMLLLNPLIALRERTAIELSSLRSSILGLIIGTVPAILLLNSISESKFSFIFGMIILIAVLVSLLGARIKSGKIVLIIVGVIAGFMNTISTISGPPMALVFQNEKGSKLRGMLAGFFLVANLISLCALIISRHFVWQEFLLFLPMIPGTLLGFWLSAKLAIIFDRSNTRLLVLLIAGFSAVMIIIKHVL